MTPEVDTTNHPSLVPSGEVEHPALPPSVNERLQGGSGSNRNDNGDADGDDSCRRRQYVSNKAVAPKNNMSFGLWSVHDTQEWNCLTCTYVNQPLFLSCEMCGQARPPPGAAEHLQNRRRADGSTTNTTDSNRQLASNTMDRQGSLNPKELGELLLQQQEENMRKERIREIMAMQQGMFNRIQEEGEGGKLEEEEEGNDISSRERIREVMAMQQGMFNMIQEEGEGGKLEEEEEGNDISSSSHHFDDSFSWRDLDNSPPTPRDSTSSSSLRSSAKKQHASNTTCATAASSSNYMDYSNSSDSSPYSPRNARNKKAGSSHYLGRFANSAHSIPEAEAMFQGPFEKFQASFQNSYAEFGERSANSTSGNSFNLGSSFGSIGFVHSKHPSSGSTEAAVQHDTSPQTNYPEPVTPAETSFKPVSTALTLPPLDHTVSPSERITNLSNGLDEMRLLRSDQQRPHSKSPRRNASAPRSYSDGASPPLTYSPTRHVQNMPATPRDVPVREGRKPIKVTSLHAPAPSELPGIRLPQKSVSDHDRPLSPRRYGGTTPNGLIGSLIPAQKKASLPPTHNPAFQMNLYADRKPAARKRSVSPKADPRTSTSGTGYNCSNSSQDDINNNKGVSSVGIPILGRMLQRKKKEVPKMANSLEP